MRGARQSATINIMVQAVEKAAFGLKRDFGEVENLQLSVRGPADFVTAADLRAERHLCETLRKKRPGWGFLMEKAGEIPGEDKEHRWLIDPLDGTANFMRGIPHFAISVALQKGDDIVAAVVYDIIRDEMFWAEKGVGCYLNGRRVRVANKRRLNECVIAAGMAHPGRGDRSRFLKQLDAVMSRVAGIRCMGAAALDLAYVATGRYDGFWEENLAKWDMAAGVLLVTEAGGYVRDPDGGQRMLDTGDVIAANDRVHPVLARTLRQSVAGEP